MQVSGHNYISTCGVRPHPNTQVKKQQYVSDTLSRHTSAGIRPHPSTEAGNIEDIAKLFVCLFFFSHKYKNSSYIETYTLVKVFHVQLVKTSLGTSKLRTHSLQALVICWVSIWCVHHVHYSYLIDYASSSVL